MVSNQSDEEEQQRAKETHFIEFNLPLCFTTSHMRNIETTVSTILLVIFFCFFISSKILCHIEQFIDETMSRMMKKKTDRNRNRNGNKTTNEFQQINK